MPARIVNPLVIRDIVRAAQAGPVGCLSCNTSNSYTFGGWDNALPMALRNYAPMKAYFRGARGHSAGTVFQNTPGFRSIDLGAGTISGTDKWNIGSESSGAFPTTGAPVAQEALFPPNASARGYWWLADGVEETSAPAPMNWKDYFAGINIRDALRCHLWGVSFETGASHVALQWEFRRVSPYAALASKQTNFVTGSVARLHDTLAVAADQSRDPTDEHRMGFNQSIKSTGPLMVTGVGIETTTVANGWLYNMYSQMGGNSLGENLDDIVKSRAMYQEILAQMADGIGSGGECFFVLNYTNDATNNPTSASWKYGGLVTSTGPSNTVTVDDATGLAAGMAISVRDASTLGYVDGNATTSIENGVIDQVIGNTVTLTGSFSRAATTGDIWRASLATDTQQTQGGYKNNLDKFWEIVSADCAAVNLTPRLLVSTIWPDDLNEARMVLFEAAMREFAAEHPAHVCAYSSSEEWTFDLVDAYTGADRIHPGGYFLASFFQRAMNAALMESGAPAEAQLLNASKCYAN